MYIKSITEELNKVCAEQVGIGMETSMGDMTPPPQKSERRIDPEAHTSHYLEKIIKDNLDIIVLCMLRERPMCGYDIIKKIFETHNVFLSQGTVYPLLYSLRDEGILRAEYSKGNMRSKIYKVTDEGLQILDIRLKHFIQAGKYVLNQLNEGYR